MEGLKDFSQEGFEGDEVEIKRKLILVSNPKEKEKKKKRKETTTTTKPVFLEQLNQQTSTM